MANIMELVSVRLTPAAPGASDADKSTHLWAGPAMCSPPSSGPSAFCRPPSDRVVLTATCKHGVDDATSAMLPMTDVAAADGVAGLHTGAARLAEMLARLWAEDHPPDDPERRADDKGEGP